MDTVRHRSRPGSDRLLAHFARSEGADGSEPGVELQEDDIFSTDPIEPADGSPMANPNLTTASALPRFSARNLGILAALPDRNPNPNPILKPKVSISSATASSSPPVSSARFIPAAPRAKPAAAKVYHQSAPVRVPAKGRRDWGREMELGGDGGEEEEMMVPPHEMVARAAGRDMPMTTFSVLEGAGRTLKGRDLRRVRNAVFRETGFLD